MAVRKKRSISLPPDLDAQIEAAAQEAGTTYSGWLADTARKEFIIRAGLRAVTEFEGQHGNFTTEELDDADAWANDALLRSKRTGGRRRRTA
jgi:Arc/MetJ-type ribon-helix-helix transcriptional regulator